MYLILLKTGWVVNNASGFFITFLQFYNSFFAIKEKQRIGDRGSFSAPLLF
jgi:hypothetical protein